MLSVKQGGIKYHFLSLWYDSIRDWTRSPAPLVNTLPLSQLAGHFKIEAIIKMPNSNYKKELVREFVLQSRYYIPFRANTLGKGMNPLILPAMG